MWNVNINQNHGLIILCVCVCHEGYSVGLNILTTSAVLSGIIMVIMDLPPVATAWHNYRKKIRLTKNRSNNEILLFSGSFSFVKARKERIWHEFWDVRKLTIIE